MPHIRLTLIALAGLLSIYGCGGSESSNGTLAADAGVETSSPGAGLCVGVDCSGFGTCYSSGTDAVCVCDPGYITEGLDCVPSATCGNGALDLGEYCDPAALNAALPCSSLHPKYESGTANCEADCTRNLSACVTSSVCGNGVVEKGESCDDGNALNGDGCSSTCASEGQGLAFACGAEGEQALDLMFAEADTTCEDPEQASQLQPDALEPIRVRVQVTRSADDGKRSDDGIDINELFASANAFLAAADLSIVWDGEAWEVANPEDSDFYNIQTCGHISALLDTNPDPEAINLYLVNTAECFLKGQTVKILGYGPMGTQSMLLQGDIPATLAHEIGHLFSLKHTHAVDDDDDCANAGDAPGDRCCDTSPDPGPPKASLETEQPEASCTSSDASDPCDVVCPNGETPPVHNTMSYYDCSDTPHPDNFTACQGARARCYLSQSLAAVLGGYTCKPDCQASSCGDDGCGGSCGECSGSGTCVDGTCACTSECLSDDILLLSSCATTNCATLELVCEDAQCVPNCEPDCSGKSCGDDGCGGDCGTCPDGGACDEGACSCAPSCLSKSHVLLPDCTTLNCGGAFGLVCEDGSCVPPCEPSCDENPCGDDGCGGTCDECPNDGSCSAGGACVCEPGCASSTLIVLTDCTTIDCLEFGLNCSLDASGEGTCTL